MTWTKPPLPRTGYAHAKCYAAPLLDCSETISREHYLSRAMLAVLGRNFRVTRPRFGWAEKPMTEQAMTAKILCERHNERLSGLDAEGAGFVHALKTMAERLDGGGGEDAFSGFDLERWLLKTLCGYVRLDGDEVPEAWVRLLFCWNDLIAPCGLHVNVAIGDSFGGIPGNVIFATAYDNDDNRTGCAFTLLGHRLLLSLDGKRVFGADELGKQSILRPSHLRWTHSVTGAVYTLWFSWVHITPGPGISIEYRPPGGRDL